MLCVVAAGVCSFVLLTGSAQVSRLEVTQTVDANYRSSYDVLVRPKGSQTAVEARTGTVRPNYLSGIYGGISPDQVEQIRAVDGVEVAAPIAMVGQVIQNVSVPIDVTDEVEAGASLFRFTSTGSNSGGLNTFDGPAGYTYVADNVSLDLTAGDDIPVTEAVGGRDVPVCRGVGSSRRGPFSSDARWFPQCWDRDAGLGGSVWPNGTGRFVVQVPVRFPVTVAAIDPDAEAKLTGLDEAMVQGDYLAEDAEPRPSGSDGVGPDVPVLYSSRSYVREQLRVQLDTLDPSTSRQLRRGLSRAQARQVVLAASTQTSRTKDVDLSRALSSWARTGRVFPRAFYEAGETAYAAAPASGAVTTPVLDAVTREPDDGVWSSSVFLGEPYAPVPWSATGPSFRELTAAPGGALERMPTLAVKGTFDPRALLQGTTLGKVPLETYQSPAVTAADDDTRRALGGDSLLPGSNPAGYLQNPPLMLTTLSSLPAITDPGVFRWADPVGKSEKPVSVVRVRVAGVTGADAVSRERVRRVAEAIQTRTGLDVDITVGSSPSPTTVEVATDSGPITVQELWVKKGVAEQVVAAVDRKSLGLFALVLLTTALSVAISANASVRARQRELAVLSCLGWRPSTLYRSVLTRLLRIGAVAGVIGAAASWPLGHLFHAPVSPARAALAVPCAVALMLLIGIAPAVAAARATPAATIRSVARPSRRARTLRGPISLAVANLLRRPARTLTASLALSVGVAALVVLVGLSTGFEGAVVGNLLGNAVALQVRSSDIVAGIVLGVIGLIAVLDVLVLEVKEQAPGYASLQASGWRDGVLMRLVLAQGFVITAIGALGGAAAGLAVVQVLVGAPTGALGAIAGIVAGALLAGTALAAIPAWVAIHLNTARILADDEG